MTPVGTALNFRRENENLSSSADVLHKTKNLAILMMPKLRARIRARIRAWIPARIRARIPARIRATMSFLRYLFSNLSVRLGLESVRLGLFRLVLV